MTIYTCELCNKIFKQKIEYTRHKNKKTPCISMKEVKDILKKETELKLVEDQLQTLFKSCMNIFRDYEAITGAKALSDFTKLLVLKIIETKNINYSDIDIDNMDYDEEEVKEFLLLSNLTKLIKEKNEDIPSILSNIVSDILPEHSKTCGIFTKDKGFNIKKSNTFVALLTKINSIDFSNISSDILGDSYELLLKDIMTGKHLGQFFTQPLIKNMMVKLVKPKIYDDGTTETIFDPAMGTGGFLLSSLSYFKEQSKVKNISLDWDFVSSEGIGGKEIECDAFQLANSNMLISSGTICSNLHLGDSIREPITEKYDVVLANPPFGIKGLQYNDIKHPLKDEYIPIKSNSAVPLFLQAIICMLKVGGRCAIVLPDGQDLFSKSNKALIYVREYLMKACDLKEIIYLPAGLFTNTSIKTCIAYFHKKKECTDVITVNKSISKTTGKETRRTYKFIKEHQTKNVKFYECDPEKDVKVLLTEASIEQLAENSYSLNYTEYVEEDEEDEEKYGDVEYKTLGEVCEIENGTRIVRKNNKEGIYPVYGSGRETFTTKTYNREGFNILIGRFALSTECVRLVDKKLFLNDSGLTIKPQNKNLQHKFLAYYIYNNQDLIYNCARGAAQKNLDMELFKNIKIPIPPLQTQQEIVEKLDFLSETCIELAKKNIEALKEKQKLYIEVMSKGKECKTLGEVCEIENGKRIVKGKSETGNYPVYGGGGVTSFYTNKYTREGTTCKISREGMSPHNCVLILREKYYLNSQGLTITSNNKLLINEYLWYFLFYNKDLVFACGRGTAQLAVDMELFKNIKIPIPPLQTQQEIVERCDHTEKLIKDLEQEIEHYKELSKQVLDSYIINTNEESEQIVYNDIIIESSDDED